MVWNFLPNAKQSEIDASRVYFLAWVPSFQAVYRATFDYVHLNRLSSTALNATSFEHILGVVGSSTAAALLLPGSNCHPFVNFPSPL